MHQLCLFSILFFLLACGTAKNVQKSDNSLNGTWKPTMQEMAGSPLPIDFFQSQKLLIEGENYTLHAESEDKGTISYKDGKMDIYSKEGLNVGKHFTAIYTLEGNKLTICYNLIGDVYPADFETKSSSFYFMSIFEKL